VHWLYGRIRATVAEGSIMHEIFVDVDIAFVAHLHFDVLGHLIETLIEIIIILRFFIIPIHIFCDGIEQIR
jgi:hypothetical protein